MVSALQSSVVIECPHCGTRYQLPPDAIGPQGRKVACAHCGETWQARAEAFPALESDEDALFDAVAERALDDEFASAERAGASESSLPAFAGAADALVEDERMRTIAEIKAAIAPRAKTPPPAAPPRPDPKAERKRQRAFAQRQEAFRKSLPVAKVRRAVRIGAVATLVSLLVLGVAFRTDLVRQFPALAGIYESLGLGVNVVGLEFRDVTTLLTLRGGNNVMQVNARIYSVAAGETSVPPVIVTITDDGGKALYEWSVVPAVRTLERGEMVDFTTQLTSPPPAARQVRLTFNDGRGRTEMPVTMAASPSE
jgi:predicted Zn finger-like uncharacterized protein